MRAVPVLLGVASALVVYVTWAVLGIPVVGVVGGAIGGIAVTTLALLRTGAQFRRTGEIEEEEEVRWPREE